MPIRAPRLSGLIEIAACASALGFLLGFLGKSWWVLDLLSHFRVQFVVGLFCCAAIFAVLRRWKHAVLGLLAATGIALTLGKWYLPAPAIPTNSARFKLVSFNVHTENDRYREVLDFLMQERADVIPLLEIDNRWLEKLAALRSEYPYFLAQPRTDNFGIAVWSKRPLAGPGLVAFGPFSIPVVDARLDILGSPGRLIGLHTLPPLDSKSSVLRNEQLLHFADLAGHGEVPTILAGDFNLTPFSPWYGEVLNTSKLDDPAKGHGCPPTWMRPIPILALPLDQALISRNFTVVARKIGPACGSDHNALSITLALPARR